MAVHSGHVRHVHAAQDAVEEAAQVAQARGRGRRDSCSRCKGRGELPGQGIISGVGLKAERGELPDGLLLEVERRQPRRARVQMPKRRRQRLPVLEHVTGPEGEALLPRRLLAADTCRTPTGASDPPPRPHHACDTAHVTSHTSTTPSDAAQCTRHKDRHVQGQDGRRPAPTPARRLE